ncbi:MAG TPA: EAL domain-containing protein [Nocardioides sp.]|nr:EAL domain-containing protein [Nocardioides sp.]
MDLSFRQAGVVLATLVAFVLTYPVAPDGAVREVWYAAVGVLCVAWAYVGLRRHSPARPLPWIHLLTGFGAWALADVVALVERTLWSSGFYPMPSDALRLLGYVLIGVGFLGMVRARQSRDLTALLDAAIIATGVAVITMVFVVDPITEDTSLSLAGKLVSAAYPLVDVLLIGLLVRLWTTPEARTVSVELLTAALAVILLADVIWNFAVVTTAPAEPSAFNDVLWLSGYALLAISVWVPSMRDASEPLPEHEPRIPPTARLALLAAGLVLPAATLLIDGVRNGEAASWLVTGVASIALTLLVLARMAGLLRTVQVQAVQLAALARADALTGAPNRRTWDHELSRACRAARDRDEPLCVAMVDLDHFKRYNDTHGHQAGDLLLREAVAAWTDLLEEGEFLARYGGEEFALILAGQTPVQARIRLDALREATPSGQTISAGVALWDPETEPGAAVAAADAALYRAKRAGRNRVALAQTEVDDALPKPTIVLQPIVDIATGEIIAEEALSRFEGADTLSAFEEAHRLGRGTELELASVAAALKLRRPDRMLSLNLTLETLVTARGWELLPDDLHGIILEITEHGDVDHLPGTDEILRQLRLRGCAVAIDDWGKGHSNLDRMLRLRPEIIKLDLSLVQGHEAPYHRAVISAITSWAEEVGALVCAEGIETPEQRVELAALGVHLGQGYLFGRPEAPRHDARTRTVPALVDAYVRGVPTAAPEPDAVGAGRRRAQLRPLVEPT